MKSHFHAMLPLTPNLDLSSKPLEPLGTFDARIADMQFICRPAIDKSTKPTTHLLVSSLQFGDCSASILPL